MKLYADLPGRRAWQLTGDLLLLSWVLLWAWLARAVHDTTTALAVPGEQLESAGAQLSGYLTEAGDRVADVPLVGDELRSPFEGAGTAAAAVAQAGRDQQAAVTDLALLLGVTVFAIPVALALVMWLPGRVRFVRRATAARRFIDAAADVDLFALRALTRQPMHVLARISDDPAGAWRQRDEQVIRALAAVELRESGLRMPAGLVK